MIAIIDYGVGNLFSLESSFRAIGAETVRTGDIDVMRKADKLLLPGVGAFGDAADRLKMSGLADEIRAECGAGKPLLGVCLGMQLLFNESEEYGVHKGLGLIPGRVVPIKPEPGLKVPQIGWNALHISRESALMRGTPEGAHVYFVHSYYAQTEARYVCATTDYGANITAAVESGNVMGAQFHPEKSGPVGLNILRAFCERRALV